MKHSTPKPISCEQALKRVFDFIDGQLKDRSREELEQHLAVCRHCFDRVEFEKLVKTRLGKLRKQTDSAELRKKISLLIDSY